MGKRRRRGFTLIEAVAVVVIMAVIAAIAIPTLSGVLQRASDRAHLISLANLGSATATKYAGGIGSPTWVAALTTVAGESTLAGDLNKSQTSILAAVTLIPPVTGASLEANTVSYQTLQLGTPPPVLGTQLGLASKNPSGTCSMVLVGLQGLLGSWVAGKLGANCTGANALLGQAASQALAYLAPSNFGTPSPIILSSSITQTYDPVAGVISGPAFTYTPSTNTNIASDEVTRNGLIIASLPSDSTAFTDSSAAPATVYTYGFTAITTSGLRSTPATAVVTTKPGSLSGATLNYTVTSGLADATLAWSAPAPSAIITGYHIYKNNSLFKAIVGTATTSILIPAQNLGTPLNFKVLPYTSGGDGLGFQVDVTFTDVAQAPTTITAVPANALADLTWTSVPTSPSRPVTGYYLFRSVANGPYLFLTAVTGQAVTTYRDSTLTNGSSYSFEIASYGAGGVGPQSFPSNIVTPIGTPLAGTVGTPILGTGQISFPLSFPSSQSAPVDHLVITRNGVIINSSYLASATSYVDSSLSPATN